MFHPQQQSGPPALPPRHHSASRSLQLPNATNQPVHPATYSSAGYQQHQQHQYSKPPPISAQQTHGSPYSDHSLGGGYTPVDFDGLGSSAVQFYGSLIDPLTSRPSQVFARLADSLFFWADSNCDVAGLRGTGVIEPAKYAWVMVKLGEDQASAQLLIEYIQSLYETAGIPCQYRTGADGRTIAVLDRRGWLHSSMFDACSDPEESCKYWSKAISQFSLVDPATSQPFPSPLPRSALPALPTPALQAVFFDWQRKIQQDVEQKKKKAQEDAENAKRHNGAYGFQGNMTAHGGTTGGGYTPVKFDGLQGNVGEFYGKFIDPVTSRPSEVYSRLSDALFFWIDANCDIPGLRTTGVIEPAKLSWITVKMGSDPLDAQLAVESLPSLYEAVGIPCQYQRGDDGQLMPVLDRRGWLHSNIFDACADPEEEWKYWSKAITLFALVDPATSLPFPSPLPRSALPTLPTPALAKIYTNWRLQAQVDMQKKKSERIMRDTMAAYGLQSAVPASSAAVSSYMGGAAGVGYSGAYSQGAPAAVGANSSTGGSTSGGTGGTGEHATMTDTINSVATLANTALGVFGGGGTGAFTFGN